MHPGLKAGAPPGSLRTALLRLSSPRQLCWRGVGVRLCALRSSLRRYQSVAGCDELLRLRQLIVVTDAHGDPAVLPYVGGSVDVGHLDKDVLVFECRLDGRAQLAIPEAERGEHLLTGFVHHLRPRVILPGAFQREAERLQILRVWVVGKRYEGKARGLVRLHVFRSARAARRRL